MTIRSKTKQSKSVLQRAGKLLLQEQIQINHVICNRHKNSVEQLSGRILKCTTYEEVHLAEKIHQSFCKKSLTSKKKKHSGKFDELIGENKSNAYITYTKKWVINIFQTIRQLPYIGIDFFANDLNFSIIFKTMPNKDIIATLEDAVKYLEIEEADTICAKVSYTVQIFKPPKDNLTKEEPKTLKTLQSVTSVVIVSPGKGGTTVILNCEDYLEKCMDYINNGPYQLLKKAPTTKIKAKTMQHINALKGNEFFDNRLYYHLKFTDLPAPRSYGRLKTHKPGVPISPIVSYSGSTLQHLNKYIANILKAQVKD